MTPLRGALTGCGYISRQQLRAWQRVTGAEIVAVCDLDPAKAAARALEFDLPASYTSFDQMLDEQRLDFVDLAVGPGAHPTLTQAAAARGLPVLCQKPMAASLAEAESMVSACQVAGVTLMINENARWQAWFRQVKAWLDAGALGEPRYARFESRWRSTLPVPNFDGQDFFQHMPRLIVYELGTHYFDTARFLFGEAHSVFARLRRVSPHIAGEDLAIVVADHGALTCVLDLDWFSVVPPGPPDVSWCTFVLEGTEGTAVLGRDGALTRFTPSAAEAVTFPPDTVDLSFAAAQQHFVDCLRSGIEPRTSGARMLSTMALVFGAYQSAVEDRVIRFR